MINPAAQRLDFFIIIRFKIPMDQKIELDVIPVNVTVVIHYHGFQPATAHVSHDMQNANHNGPPWYGAKSKNG